MYEALNKSHEILNQKAKEKLYDLSTLNLFQYSFDTFTCLGIYYCGISDVRKELKTIRTCQILKLFEDINLGYVYFSSISK